MERDKIEETIKLKPGKAPGNDGIMAEMLKYDVVVEYLGSD